jgi:hypothetical protein
LGTRPLRESLGVRSFLLAAPEILHYAKGIAPVQEDYPHTFPPIIVKSVPAVPFHRNGYLYGFVDHQLIILIFHSMSLDLTATLYRFAP